jgi:hypothetical protein
MNKRTQPRRRARDFGRIIFPGGQPVVACVILDISDGGALLFVDAGAAKDTIEIPDSFSLFRRASKSIHDAKVVRRAAKTIGVRFLSTVDVSSTDDKRLGGSKR